LLRKTGCENKKEETMTKPIWDAAHSIDARGDTVIAGLSVSRRLILVGAIAALAAPQIARGEGKNFRIGMLSVFSGATAQTGVTHRNAVQMEVERINASGGLAGRQIEVLYRDSKGQAQEAARLARELVNSENCDMLLNADTSASTFAIQEVVRDLGVLCIHSSSETSSLTADPKYRVATAFRSSRQGIHDAIVGGAYAAKIAKEKKLTRWATTSPDYAYGRDTTAQYLEYLAVGLPNLELVTQTWPKLGAPDYTEVITKLIQARPQAMYTALFGGDLTAFVNQSAIYALFGQMTVFSVNLADYTALTAIKSLPAGIESGNRYLANFPDTPSNHAWADGYRKRYNEYPTNWSWESATALLFLEAAAKQAGSADPKRLAETLRGLKIACPFGSDGTVTMRAEDQTVIGYAIGWGPSTPNPPYVTNIQAGDWGRILEAEAEWKKRSGFV
jgi:branched-chain amino acid transport system substrate-binding protein